MTKINSKNSKIKLRKILALKKSLKSIFLSKIFIAIFFTIIGAGSVVFANNFMANQNKSDNLLNYVNYGYKMDDDFKTVKNFQSFHDHFENSFFAHDDFFKEMQEIENSFNRVFEQRRKYFNKIFEQSFQNKNQKSFSGFKVTNEQDDQNLTYILEYKGCKDCEILVNINNGFLTFKTENSEITKDHNQKSKNYQKSYSNFYYSLAVPDNFDLKNPQITRDEGLIKVKLKKM